MRYEAKDQRSAGDDQTPGIQVWLEVELDEQPIKGSLRMPDGDVRPFVGWLGLTSCLTALRTRPKTEGGLQ